VIYIAEYLEASSV